MCKAPVGKKLTDCLDMVQNALKNYCKKDLFGYTKSIIIILYLTIIPNKNNCILLLCQHFKLFKMESVRNYVSRCQSLL